MRSTRRSAVPAAMMLLCVSVLPLGPAAAGELVLAPGLTPPQRSMAAAIDIVCPKLLAAGFATQDSATGDLTRRCREMRQTANALQGVGPTAFSLGLTNDQLANALGLLTPEQAAAQGRPAFNVEANPSRAIAGRLSALRQGARGITAGDLRLDIDGKAVASSRPLGLDGRGGGASADAPGSAGGLGAFVNGSFGFGDKDGTERESGFDFEAGLATAGVDYRFTDSLVAGLAASYSRTTTDFEAGLGDADTQRYGLSLYATNYWGALYVDLLAGFAWNVYDMTRRISYGAGPGAGAGAAGVAVDLTALGDTDGPQYTVNVGTGYEFRAAGFSVTPFLRLEFTGLHIDGYTESGASGLDLTVKSQDVFSLQQALGGQLARPFSTPIAVLVPSVRAEWRHEFLDSKRRITAKYANDPFNIFFSIPTDGPDRDFFALAAGLSAQFPQGIAAFFNYDTVLGLRDVTSHNFTGGVRVEF